MDNEYKEYKKSEYKFWSMFVLCLTLVLLAVIAGVVIYEVEYLRLVKPETVPTLRWPSSGNL